MDKKPLAEQYAISSLSDRIWTGKHVFYSFLLGISVGLGVIALGIMLKWL